jgi:hypothetical protein
MSSGRPAPLHWTDSDGEHVDVRGLVPPAPMVAILALIEGGAAGPIIAHLDRDPVFLYPELADRGWTATPRAGDPGEVRLRLARAGT